MHQAASFDTRVFVVLCTAAVLFLFFVFINLILEPKRRDKRRR